MKNLDDAFNTHNFNLPLMESICRASVISYECRYNIQSEVEFELSDHLWVELDGVLYDSLIINLGNKQG